MAITQFEFVLLDPPSNLKPGKNSLQIRRRCMQGKNKRGGSRRSQMEERKLIRDRASDEQKREAARRNVQGRASPQLISAHQAFDLLTKPRITGWEMQFNRDGAVLEAFAYDIINSSFSPFDRCVDFESIAGHMVPFERLLSDKLFVDSIMATGYALNDFLVLGKSARPTQKTMQHLHNTLSLLQGKLQDPYAYQDEPILHAVLNLAMLAGGFGHWAASIVHLRGLQKIIRLNGDIEFLAKWPKLHFKLDRIDLVWSLSSGKDPFFTRAPETWEPIFASLPSKIASSTMRSPPTGWGTPLAAAFTDLQNLSLQINLTARARSRYGAADFCSILTSLQSRLLFLRHSTRSLGLYSPPQFPYVDPIAIDVEDPMREFMRLAMLAFLTTTFEALGNNMPFQWIGAQLAEIVPKIFDQKDEEDDDFLLWGLAIAGVSVVNPERQWFRQAWVEIERGQDWEAIRQRLMKVMWIEVAHDTLGVSMFEFLHSL